MEKVKIEINHWMWIGGQSTEGYGKIGLGGRSEGSELAHIVSYQLFVGPIDDDLLVLHKCDIKLCVNPKCLYLGTYANNYRDRIERGDGGLKAPYQRLIRDAETGRYMGAIPA